jgi:hypothetical protein
MSQYSAAQAKKPFARFALPYIAGVAIAGAGAAATGTGLFVTSQDMYARTYSIRNGE